MADFVTGPTQSNSQRKQVKPSRAGTGLWAVCLLAAAGAGLPAAAGAAHTDQSWEIRCGVSDGRGLVSYGHSKYLGEAAGTSRFSRWVFAQEGVNLTDRIGLFWNPSGSRNRSLRVALDGPVSKPAQLVSITDDTLAATVVTSDRNTTRTWLLTVNFEHEAVVAVAMSSGAVAVKAQMMMLTCRFNAQQDARVFRSAADTWRR